MAGNNDLVRLGGSLGDKPIKHYAYNIQTEINLTLGSTMSYVSLKSAKNTAEVVCQTK